MAEAGHVRHDGCNGGSPERVVLDRWRRTLFAFSPKVLDGWTRTIRKNGAVGLLRTYHDLSVSAVRRRQR
jgi:hypothetical protein